MSNKDRLTLIEEIERTLQEFLDSDEIQEERKTEVLRELLAMTEMEQ